MTFVLCVDDEPIRYRRLAQLLARHEGQKLLFTCNPLEIEEYLGIYPKDIFGVCLDHDLPPGRSENRNGLQLAREFFAERGYPVAVTSSNQDGARQIEDFLEHWAVPCLLTPVTHPGWEERALRHFEKARIDRLNFEAFKVQERLSLPLDPEAEARVESYIGKHRPPPSNGRKLS